MEFASSVPPRSHKLQRMFSTFPGGWPGAGLLLLRASIGAASFAQGLVYVTRWDNLMVVTQAAGLLAVAIGALLLIGYMTPVASALAAIIGFCEAWLFQTPPSSLFDSKPASALAISVAVSLACLGPGAYSIDARLFGRREVVISKPSHSSRP